MQNRKTYEGNHNAKPIEIILTGLRKAREELVRKLDQLDETAVATSSLHPRLNKPMRVIDWVYFMAEHDDHHLARITQLKRILTERKNKADERLITIDPEGSDESDFSNVPPICIIDQP